MEQRHSTYSGCIICNLETASHSYRDCPVFIALKNATSPLSYRDLAPRVEEELGFMAAGILPINSENRILLIRETRKGKVGYNFIGGKRERLAERLESPFETALAEFEEETGSKFLASTWRHVLWFPKSKYLLFVVGCSDSVSNDKCKWFTLEELEGSNILHAYVKLQLRGDFSQLIRID